MPRTAVHPQHWSVSACTTIACSLLVLAACAETPPPPPTVAFRGVTVVDVADGSLRADQTVLVRDNRIVAAGPAGTVELPANADVVEGAGRYLMPGLWDMHVHSVNSVDWDARVTGLSTRDWHFSRFLAWGVTGVRNMNDATGDPSLRLINDVKRRLASGELLGPRVLANGPTVDGHPSFASNAVLVRTPDEARALVDQLADSGADFIKLYESVPRDAYFALMEQAGRRGLPVDGHIPFRVTPIEAAEAGQRTFEHLLGMAAGCATDAASERDRFAAVLASMADNPSGGDDVPMEFFLHERALHASRNPAACAATIAAYLRHGVADAPSIVSFHAVVRAKEIVSDETRMRLLPEPIRRNWREMIETEMYQQLRDVVEPMVPFYFENARMLHEAGVTLLAATDVGVPMVVPGISLHDELELLVASGLTPLDALRTATLNPARVLGLAYSLGTVEAGKLADLVLLDANPIADIRNTRRIQAVVADGRLFRRADLDRLEVEVGGSTQVNEPQ